MFGYVDTWCEEDNWPCAKNNINEVCLVKSSSLDDLTNHISDGCFDEIFIMGDFSCDPNKGRFFRELRNMANRRGLLCYDVDVLPAST